MVYRWIVFVHVGAALVFMLAHGASASVAFRLRRERDVARLSALLDLSGASYWAMSYRSWPSSPPASPLV